MTDTRPADGEWMTATEAAARLGVSRASLYAYVSRGLLRALPGARNASRYRRAEVERLAARHAAARRPRRAAVQTLDWGLPVLGSALTLIERGRLYYRGHDAVALAATATLEDVAQLLWQGGSAEARAGTSPCRPPPRGRALPGLATVPQPRRLLDAWALLQAVAGDPPDEPMAQAAGLLQRMAWAATLQTPRTRAAHVHLQRAWGLPTPAADALRRALVLCADHELNASSFAVRCVAGTGASLDACVGAGLAALSGPRHGGMTARVEASWPQWMAPQPLRMLRRQLQQHVDARLAQRRAERRRRVAGDLLAGFGHPLYPDGDPRARALLALLPPDPQRTRCVALVHELTGLAPALDFALVALRRHLGAPEGAAFAVFALGRTAGWIAHALEQRADGSLIRPRALYQGPRPALQAVPTPSAGRVVRAR